MSAAILYIVESAVIFSVLTGFYKYAYYTQTYYKWDRIFLITCIAISYTLPMCKIKDNTPTGNADSGKVVIKNYHPLGKTGQLTLVREVDTKSKIKKALNSDTFHNILAVLGIIYIAGAVIKAIGVARGFIKIRKLMTSNPEKLNGGINIHHTGSKTVAFSFFRNIFVNSQFALLADNEKATILQHELRHINGHHSIDTIIFEILGIAQWFNPSVKTAAMLSRQVCENIADNDLSGTQGKTEYSLLLLKLGQQNVTKQYSYAPRQNTAQLKERILNIFSYDTAKSRKIRFIASTPILLLAISGYLILGGKLQKGETCYMFPIRGNYQLAAEYFENKVFTGENNQIFQISHRETSFTARQGTKIIAPTDGTVTKVEPDTIRRQQLFDITIATGEAEITIKSIAQTDVAVAQKVHKGERIGTTGNPGITINIATEVNGKNVNPALLFNY